MQALNNLATKALVFQLEHPTGSESRRSSLFQRAADQAMPINGSNIEPRNIPLLQAVVKVAPKFCSDQYFPDAEAGKKLKDTVTRIFKDRRLIDYLKEADRISQLVGWVSLESSSGGHMDATLPLRLVISTLVKSSIEGDLEYVVALLSRLKPPLLSRVMEGIDRDASENHIGYPEVLGWLQLATEMSQLPSLLPFVQDIGLAASFRQYQIEDKHRLLYWGHDTTSEEFDESVKKLENLTGKSDRKVPVASNGWSLP